MGLSKVQAIWLPKSAESTAAKVELQSTVTAEATRRSIQTPNFTT